MNFFLSFFFLIQVGLQLYMGVLRQKCVPTYESFLNDAMNSSNFTLNMTYEIYLKEIDNESRNNKRTIAVETRSSI